MKFIDEILYYIWATGIAFGIVYGAFTHKMTFGETIISCILLVLINHFISIKEIKGNKYYEV